MTATSQKQYGDCVQVGIGVAARVGSATIPLTVNALNFEGRVRPNYDGVLAVNILMGNNIVFAPLV